jgi:hypothetical protein
MLADIGQYLWDLADNWAAFMTGGLIAALFTLVERIRGKQFSPLTFILVFLVFGFGAASFQTWRHEYQARLQAEQSVSRAATIKQLQKYYSEAAQFARLAALSTTAADDQYAALLKEVDSWSKDSGAWIIQNMGEAAYYRVIHVENIPDINAVPQRRQLEIVMRTIRDNIGHLLENPTWDKQ